MLTTLTLILFSGCFGSVTVPDTSIAQIQQKEDSILKRMDTVLQSQAMLEGRVNLLITLKQKELEALESVNEGLKLNQKLFERILDTQLDLRRGGSQRQ